MRKSWGLTDKILTGEKKIESRWYSTRRAPWGRISAGDSVYFKNSGEPVRIRAEVSKVLQFENLSEGKVLEILSEYGKMDGIPAGKSSFFRGLFKHKRYCMLIFLKNAKPVKPFHIDKKGFGAMSAWLTVENIGKIKIGD